MASCIGAFLCLTPLPLAAALAVFVITVAATRFISLGSVFAAGSLPLAVWLISHPPLPVVAAAILAGAFIIWRHRSNLERLRAGKEHVFSFGDRRK
jgi:glycerol-3-phosphate acyltransferase PlsY